MSIERTRFTAPGGGTVGRTPRAASREKSDRVDLVIRRAAPPTTSPMVSRVRHVLLNLVGTHQITPIGHVADRGPCYGSGGRYRAHASGGHRHRHRDRPERLPCCSRNVTQADPRPRALRRAPARVCAISKQLVELMGGALEAGEPSGHGVPVLLGLPPLDRQLRTPARRPPVFAWIRALMVTTTSQPSRCAKEVHAWGMI